MPIVIKKKLKPKKLKPGQKAGLTREKIAHRAMGLIEADPEFTLKDLAVALNVAPMAIRNHFPEGLQEIKTDISRRLLSAIGRPFHPHETWEDYLRDLLVSSMELFGAHPKLAAELPIRLAANYSLNPYLVERVLFAFDLAGIPKPLWPRTLDFVLTNLIGLWALRFEPRDSIAEGGLDGDGAAPGEFPKTQELRQELKKSSTGQDLQQGSTALATFVGDQLIKALKVHAQPPVAT